MNFLEARQRYDSLSDEFLQMLRSIQQGLLSSSEAAIAVADLQGRMDNLQRITVDGADLKFPPTDFLSEFLNFESGLISPPRKHPLAA